MDFLVDIHSIYRWVVLVVLLGAAAFGIWKARSSAVWEADSDRPFALATVVFDIQIALGIILWIGNKGWEQDFFIKVIHPFGMLVAVVVAHIAVSRARKSSSFAIAGYGLLIALAIVAFTIPRYAW